MTLSHPDYDELNRRVGVTHYIRTKLNFYDETLWKRFSARRLELIDAMELSSRKASEQEEEIKRVGETLRLEFEYGPEYRPDFDRLVRAAIQSVRRNRKRSLKQSGTVPKKARNDLVVAHSDHPPVHPSPTPEEPSGVNFSPGPSVDEEVSQMRFVTEIARLQSDSQDDADGYNRAQRFTLHDRSRAVIDSILQPKLLKPSTRTMPLLGTSGVSGDRLHGALGALLAYIERSKTCAEATSKHNPNIEELGRSAVQCCVPYLFETFLSETSVASVEYLSTRITSTLFLATFYRTLDPNQMSCEDDVVVLSLYTLIGGCIKDFGFGPIMQTLCEAIYTAVTQSYPLLTKRTGPCSLEKMSTSSSTAHLDSLAAIATKLQVDNPMPVTPPLEKKGVTLRYMNSVLSFSYPATTSAVPKLVELLDNGRNAFQISHLGYTRVLGLRNMRDGKIINSDSTLETIFKRDERIELELYIHDSKPVAISDLTSMVNSSNQNTLVVPPAVVSKAPSKTGDFPFLLQRKSPPPPKPTFQPLL